MDKQQLIEALKSEGFPIVYGWTDEPNTKYDKHKHEDRVSFYLLKGDVTFDFSGEKKTVAVGERFDVPVGREHKAIVGDAGAEYVVGAMKENDS
jgi:quercetin dioxygenase-like cupin family protein